MKKRLSAMMLTLLMTVMCYARPLAVNAVDDQRVIPTVSSATAAVLYEPLSGRVLFEQNAHTRLPMASTTKLMTALIACERLPVDTVLTASEQALAVEGSSMGLRVGDTITRDDLLRGLLLSSGNDAANVLALSMADSFEAFAVLMNDRAASIGMTHSCFVTPSGLDADGHGASAYDMALLAAEVLNNETLSSICASKTATITVGDRSVTLHNHNRLLSCYDGAVGMKTGYTSKAGRCLVSAARRDGVTMIAVTLNCADDWQEHMTLLDEGFALMRSVTLSPPVLSPVRVYGAVTDTVSVAASAATVTILRDDAPSVQTVVRLPSYIWGPVENGTVVGTVEYRLHGMTIAERDIAATSSAAAAAELSFSQRVLRLFMLLTCHALT